MTSPRQIALVTGASRGIGLAIAKHLAQDGFDIWLNDCSNLEVGSMGENVFLL